MTQEPRMTIHHALAELKLVDNQIIKLTNDITFVIANKHSNTKIGGMTKEEYKKEVKSKYDRLRALIKRHRAIKAAILESNATTTITATATGTVTANFEEDLSSDWKLIGDNQTNSPFGDNYTYSSGKAMTKKSGHSTESNVYITLDIKHLPASYYGF